MNGTNNLDKKYPIQTAIPNKKLNIDFTEIEKIIKSANSLYGLADTILNHEVFQVQIQKRQATEKLLTDRIRQFITTSPQTSCNKPNITITTPSIDVTSTETTEKSTKADNKERKLKKSYEKQR